MKRIAVGVTLPAVAVLALAALAIGCGKSDDAAPPVDLIETLSQPGPHSVGFRSIEVRYDAPLMTDQRRIQVLVWYPSKTVAATDDDRPLYVLKASEVAVTDAPPLDLGPLPVVAFSHGHQAYAAVMSHFMEHLASHGFLVIAPTHTGNTFANGAERDTDIYYLRARDVGAAIDHVAGLSGDPLSGKVGTKMLIAGHSFGGYTAYALGGASYPIDDLVQSCAAGSTLGSFCKTLDMDQQALFRGGLKDSRFSGVFALDSGNFDLFNAGVGSVDVPVLHMVAEQSGNPPMMPAMDDYWVSLGGTGHVRANVLGAAHNDFMDSCSIGVLLRCSDLVPERVLEPTRVYGLAFAKSILLGDASMAPVLDGTTNVSDIVEITTR